MASIQRVPSEASVTLAPVRKIMPQHLVVASHRAGRWGCSLRTLVVLLAAVVALTTTRTLAVAPPAQCCAHCKHAGHCHNHCNVTTSKAACAACAKREHLQWCRGGGGPPPPPPPPPPPLPPPPLPPSRAYPADKVRLIGRWYNASTVSPSSTQQQAIGQTAWGCSFTFRFRNSSSATARLSNSLGPSGKKEDGLPTTLYYVYSVDGGNFTRIALSSSEQQLTLASGLDATQEHTVLVGRSDEAFYGITTLHSVELDAGFEALELPVPKGLRYEAIGDSITAGWNVYLPAGTENDGGTKAQDVFKSYEYLLAKAWGWDDWRAIARSGIGAIPVDGSLPMRDEYTCSSFHDEEGGCPLAWNFSSWQADVVTVNLGTNDYSLGAEPSAATFLHYYGGLLSLIRQKHPGAVIFALCPLQYSCPEGAAGKDDPAKWARMLSTMRQAVAERKDAKVHLIETGNSSAPWLDCDKQTVDGTHPTVSGHKIFAEKLQQALSPFLPQHAAAE